MHFVSQIVGLIGRSTVRSFVPSIDRSIDRSIEQSRFAFTRITGTDRHARFERFYFGAVKRNTEGITMQTTRNAYLPSHILAIMREKNRASRGWKRTAEAVGGFLRQPHCNATLHFIPRHRMEWLLLLHSRRILSRSHLIVIYK